MLRLEALDLSQGDFRLLADFAVAEPGLVAVIGPSGAGKSTLLAAVAGFFPPRAGRVLWNDGDITGLAPSERPVTTLFQDNNLFPHLSLEDNIGLGISPALRLSTGDRGRIAEALDRVGLGGLGRRRPAEISGGQQSRAALARALVMDRPIVLLDEPFSALGPGLKTDMLRLLTDVVAERGLTALMVTHDPDDARRFAPKTVTVIDGRAEGPFDTKALFEAPSEAMRDYLGQ